MRTFSTFRSILILSLVFVGCATTTPAGPAVIPSLQYARQVRGEHPLDIQARSAQGAQPAIRNATDRGDPRARMRLVSDDIANDAATVDSDAVPVADTTGEHATPQLGSDGVRVENFQNDNVPIRDYNGPLSLGDPGVSASLWRESRGGNDLYHDHRAYQAMDLITIVVSEKSSGSKQADTEVKSKSSVTASLAALFGLEDNIQNSNPNINIPEGNAIEASAENNYKGEGDTSRKGSLTARISAMVVEVLPSGILRIEGEKIIAVNSEEQVMVLSGLVRPRDVNSNNEVDSSQIANMRIDYYGRGVIGEAQHGGWGSRLLRTIWPF